MFWVIFTTKLFKTQDMVNEVKMESTQWSYLTLIFSKKNNVSPFSAHKTTDSTEVFRMYIT